MKWREFVNVKGFWGDLTDKNNPAKRPGDAMLFQFPKNSYAMGSKPYWEVEAGIHNIFKLISIGYVRRLSYLDHPGISKWGVRFDFYMSF